MLTGTTWWIWPAIAAGVTALIFLWWWLTLIPGPRGQEHSNVAAKALGWAAFVTLSLALAMFAVPAVIAWLSGSHAGAVKTVLDDLGFGNGAAWSPAAIGGFVAAVIAVSQSARTVLVKYDLLKSPEAAPVQTRPKPGVAAKAIAYLRGLRAALAGQHPGPGRVRRGRAALGEGRRGGRIHGEVRCGWSSAHSRSC